MNQKLAVERLKLRLHRSVPYQSNPAIKFLQLLSFAWKLEEAAVVAF